MINEKFPYLCGGVLFLLLDQVKQAKTTARDHANGIRNRNSDIEMMKDLILALRLGDANKEEPLYFSDSFAKDVSKYRNCKVNGSSNLPFSQASFVSTYDSLVRNRYSKAMERMQEFIEAHLDLDRREWLVKAILDTIERDMDIADSDQFFIAYDGMPKAKAELRSMKSFYLPAVLVGVMHYILLSRSNNMDGLDTLEKWTSKQSRRPRTYIGNAGECIDRKIEVILECPHSTRDLGVQKIEELPEVNQIPPRKYAGDTDKYIDRENNAISECSKPSPDVVIQNSENTEESLVVNQKSSSELDVQLYEYFKTDSQDILTYVIEHDPAGEPIERLLPYNIDQLIKFWKRRAHKIEDGGMRETILRILDLVNQYRYYISDEFLRVNEEQNILIFRNQSIEEGRKLKEILRPKTAELRLALRQEYRKLHNMPEIDQDFLNIIFEEEEEALPQSGFHDPPLPEAEEGELADPDSL